MAIWLITSEDFWEMLGGQSFEELDPGFDVTLQYIIIIIMYHNIP